MKTIFIAPLVFLISLLFPLCADHLEDKFSPSIIQAEAKAIDKILNSTYQKREVKIPAKIDESALVRRLYLSLVGRIPTFDEINSYLSNTSVQKKSQLIEKLTKSSGYDSHMFNWWADLLRLKSRMRGGNQIQAGQLYNHWVKEQVVQNVPFDQMTYSLVTAEGYPWENGAVGYYLRDTGMPLDNMSNTAQIFLGTQMVCAQCHNHPFDKWTQMEYYKMASFTYGISTRMGQDLQKKIGQYFYQQTKGLSKTEKRKLGNSQKAQVLRKAIQEMVQPLRYGATHTGKKLNLPHDYQYEDAKPKTLVNSEPIFAPDSLNKKIENPVNAYGQWIISTNNPRFTQVISNRMWKKVFGRGIIEPVDDLRDDSESSIPELLTHLESLMVRVKYDLKEFQKILHNVEAFEREATGRELTSVEKYYFEAPILKRMSAEQLWDSIVALSIPEVDERKADSSKVEFRLANFANYQKKVEGLSEKKFVQLAKKGAKENVQINNTMNEIQLKIRDAQEADDRQAVSMLRREYGKKRNEQKSLFAGLVMGSEFDAQSLYRGAKSKTSTDTRWKGYSENLMRASEIETPAPPGHFLREFGQSDREVIENSSSESSVPQALTLLNGVFYKALFDPKSPLSRNLLKANSSEEKIKVLFLSILNRNPSPEELTQSLAMVTSSPKVPYQIPLPKKVSPEKKKKYLNSIEGKKQKLSYYNDRDFRGIAWSLMNTRQFSFIQ
ncbi:MAG: DUF1549 domain-containing protein [Opitutae bacterium]|jgi:hypothetical protein|nr:DUF1549 domain-containing protein [Opitutae bacterium]